jgi:hypothetical protein
MGIVACAAARFNRSGNHLGVMASPVGFWPRDSPKTGGEPKRVGTLCLAFYCNRAKFGGVSRGDLAARGRGKFG